MLVVNYWYGYIILMDLIKFLENIFVEFYNLLKYNFNLNIMLLINLMCIILLECFNLILMYL